MRTFNLWGPCVFIEY